MNFLLAALTVLRLQWSEPVCFKCVISGHHKGHEVEELTKTHENIKRKKLKPKLIPKFQRNNAEIENSLSRENHEMVRAVLTERQTSDLTSNVVIHSRFSGNCKYKDLN